MLKSVGLLGGSITGAQNALGVNNGRRVAIIGDSMVAYNLYQVGTDLLFTPNGLLSALQNRWGHRFYVDPTLIKGVGGETSTQVLARYNTDIAANYNSFDWLIIQCGANDATQTVSAATTVSNITTMAEAAADNGKRVIIVAPFPRSTWTGASVSTAASRFTMMAQRHRILDYGVRTQRKIYVVDAFDDIMNPASATSDPLSSPVALMADGLHGATAGMFSFAARRLAADLDALVPPRPFKMGGANDTYDATYNPLGNLLPNAAFLTGTGGTVTNVGGAAPSGWTATKYAGTFTTVEVVASNVAAVAGYDNVGGAKTRIAVNIATKTSNENVALELTSRISSGFTAGTTRMYAACRVDLSSVTNMKQIYLSVNERDSVPTTLKQYGDGSTQIGTSNFLYPENQTWYLRTPDFVVQPTTATIGVNVQSVFDGSASATANIDISAVELRVVNY